MALGWEDSGFTKFGGSFPTPGKATTRFLACLTPQTLPGLVKRKSPASGCISFHLHLSPFRLSKTPGCAPWPPPTFLCNRVRCDDAFSGKGTVDQAGPKEPAGVAGSYPRGSRIPCSKLMTGHRIIHHVPLLAPQAPKQGGDFAAKS